MEKISVVAARGEDAIGKQFRRSFEGEDLDSLKMPARHLIDLDVGFVGCVPTTSTGSCCGSWPA